MNAIRLTITILSLFFCGCAAIATNPSVIPLNYQGPIAEKPCFKGGDYWVYVTQNGALKRQYEFLRKENGQLVFRIKGGKSRRDFFYTDEDLAVLKRVDEETGQVIIDNGQNPFYHTRFPLFIGKKWQFVFRIIPKNSGSDTVFRCEVISYQKIIVAAGTFNALQIQAAWHSLNSTDRRINTFWYAPTAKQIVKYKYEDAETVELFKYQTQ